MSARKVIGCKRLDGGADCLVTLGCSGCANAIYEKEVARACGTCHNACDCREHKVAVLIKAALDAATQLDVMSSGVIGVLKHPDDESYREDKCKQIVARVYDACEQLGEKIGISVDEGVPA